MSLLNEFFRPIKTEFAMVDTVIKQSLADETYPEILQINQYLQETPGKRLRPALLLFSFFAVADKESIEKNLENAVKVAAAIELIHMASLVHDDIIDSAEERHNKPALHQKFGEEVGIAMGVYLYAKSLMLLSEAESLDVLSVISATVNNLCRGEMVQVMGRDNPNLSLAAYTQILQEKTGVLFAAACRCGVLLGQGNDTTATALYSYGESLGITFQIADDYMDIMGDKETLKKQPGQDFELGEVTLPLLLLLEANKNTPLYEEITTLINRKNKVSLLTLREMIKKSDAPKNTQVMGKSYIKKARESVTGLRESKYKKSLLNLLLFVEKRGF